MNSITNVGIDAHKKPLVIAYQLPDSDVDTFEEFTINNNERDIKRFKKQIKKKAPGKIKICYEAGYFGFALQRQLADDQIECQVIAPSLIPKEKGDRVKTDRKDARKLCRYLRAGLLTEVMPPSEADEAFRDLTRMRKTMRIDLNRVKKRLLRFLVSRGYIYNLSDHWTLTHYKWLRALKLDNQIDRLMLSEYLYDLSHSEQRITEIENHIKAEMLKGPHKEAVAALQCFHGIKIMSAIVLVAELHGFGRFNSPKQLMHYLGLTPSEHTSSDNVRKGGITKAGNKWVRTALVESAKHFRHKPLVSKELKKRREGQEQWVIDVANKCHKRLYQRYWHFEERGKEANKRTVAIARELAGFVWAILNTQAAIVPNE